MPELPQDKLDPDRWPGFLHSRVSAHRVLSVWRCASCGDDHPNLVFEEFPRPINLDLPMTHWAPCPTNGEPIFLSLVS